LKDLICQIFQIKSSIVTDNGDTVYFHYDGSAYVERDNRKNVLKSFSRGPGSEGLISGYDYSYNPIFGIYKKFYADGGIMEKGGFCWFGFKIGKWFYYDKIGNILNIIDYDEGYNFDERKIFHYCLKNNIPLKKVLDGPRTTMHKIKSNDKNNTWVITYPNYDSGFYMTVVLDGGTGRLLKKDQTLFPQN